MKGIIEKLEEYNISPQSIITISTINVKRDEPVVKSLQKEYEVFFYTAEELATMDVPHPSQNSDEAHGYAQCKRGSRIAVLRK